MVQRSVGERRPKMLTTHAPRIKLLKMLTNLNFGGTERQVANLVSRIDPSRFDLHLACFSNSGELQRDVEHLQIPRPEFKISRLYSPGTFRQAGRFAQYIRRNHIQIVHTYGFYPNVFAIPAARVAGAVIIASIRDTGDGLTSVQRRIQKLVCKMADCVLVNAEAIRKTLVAEGYRQDNILVIRNGINLPAFRENRSDGELRNSLGLPRSARMVLVFARLNQLKGVDYFLDAAVSVAARFPDVHFVIAGGGAHRKALEEHALQLGLADRVVFTGFRTDIPALLSEATLSVLPSLSEGLSNSLLESMAAGVPAIATRVGGNPEVIEDGVTGLLVPARDARSLAEAMSLVLGDSELAARLGEAGPRRVAQYFSVERTVSETEQLYRKLVGVPV
jgi:glycosyltransferase involved in cell wall biosynthesis